MEPVKVRASSLAELFDFPARWEAKHLLKMRLPRSAAAQIGTAVHAGTAAYDESLMSNQGLSIDDAAGALVDAIQKPKEDVDWSEVNQSEAEKLALPLHKLYCEKVAPEQDYIAVETLCDDLTISDIGLTLAGTVDRVRQTDQGLGIADIKTGKTAVGADGLVKTQGHAIQMGAYELLAGQALGQSMEAPAQIIGLQVAKTDRGRRVGTGEVTSAIDLLLDSEDGEPGLLRHAGNIIHGGNFYGNPRSALCNPRYCPRYQTCKWRR